MRKTGRIATHLALAAVVYAAGAGASADAPLTLADAIARAQEHSAPARLAGNDKERAEAQLDLARSALLPRLEGNAYETRRTVNLKAQGFAFPGLPSLIGPFDSFDARLSLSQTIFDARAFLTARGARLATGIASAQDAVAREQAASRATLAYIGVLRAEQAVAAAEADAKVARELSTLAQDQRHAGVASGVDVARAQTLVSQDEFALAQARASLISATIALRRLIALPQGGTLTLADGLDYQPQPLPDADSAVHKALQERQELAALMLRRDSREYERDAAKARRLPSLSAFADYGWSGNTPSENREDTYMFGAKIGMPIFSGGAISADIRNAEAGLTDVAIQLDDAQAQVEQDVRTALAQAASADEQVRAAQATQSLAEQELNLARDRFAHGVGNNIDVVEAQGALSHARAGAIEALASAQVARANLAAALGSAGAFHLPPASRPVASE